MFADPDIDRPHGLRLSAIVIAVAFELGQKVRDPFIVPEAPLPVPSRAWPKGRRGPAALHVKRRTA